MPEKANTLKRLEKENKTKQKKVISEKESLAVSVSSQGDDCLIEGLCSPGHHWETKDMVRWRQ